jgi:hypothetical protein
MATHRPGAQLATARMPAQAPMHSAGYRTGADPQATWNEEGTDAMTRPSNPRSLLDSFMPTMRGWEARSAARPGGQGTPVKSVIEYRYTGTGEASATAVKWRRSASAVICGL